MKKTLSIVMILILSIFFVGCDKNIEFTNTSDNNGTNTENNGPVANAGVDRTTTVSTSIKIEGSATAGDGEIIGYEWKEGAVLLSGLKQFTYTAPSVEGNHTLILTVVDDNDKVSSDSMVVTVTPR